MSGGGGAGTVPSHANPTDLPRRASPAPRRWPSPPPPRSSPPAPASPLFTNSAQNTQFFEWPAQGAGIDAYRVQYRYYANNAEFASPTVNYGTSAGCAWANWSGVAKLQHGGQYGICAQGQLLVPQRLAVLPRRPELVLDGHDARPPRLHDDRPLQADRRDHARRRRGVHARTPRSPLQVDFADDVAGPFPANFLCFQFGGGADGLCDSDAKGFIYGYNAPCSVPGERRQVDHVHLHRRLRLGREPGARRPVWACVRAADAAIPDNPNELNQSASAGQGQPVRPDLRRRRARPHRADRRDRGVLDRGQGRRPRVLPGAADRTPPPAWPAPSQWTWGDNTAGGSGDAVYAHVHAGRHL